MKKIALAFAGAALACVALTACSGARVVEKADGTKKATVVMAPGTTATGPNGGCVDSRGGTCQQQPTGSAQ